MVWILAMLGCSSLSGTDEVADSGINAVVESDTSAGDSGTPPEGVEWFAIRGSLPRAGYMDTGVFVEPSVYYELLDLDGSTLCMSTAVLASEIEVDESGITWFGASFPSDSGCPVPAEWVHIGLWDVAPSLIPRASSGGLLEDGAMGIYHRRGPGSESSTFGIAHPSGASWTLSPLYAIPYN